MNRASSLRGVHAAIFTNILIALMKFFAAHFSGSSALSSEAIHSLADPAVAGMGRPLTTHFGPEEILVNVDVHFRHNSAVSEGEEAVNRIGGRVKAAFPQVRHIYLEAKKARPAKACRLQI